MLVVLHEILNGLIYPYQVPACDALLETELVVVVDTDHRYEAIGVTIGEVVHRVATDRLYSRCRGIKYNTHDIKKTISTFKFHIGIRTREITHGIVGYRIGPTANIDSLAYASIRCGTDVGRGVHQVADGVC